ncbi:hypothetical protein RXV86_18885 [Alisedimentitalea sp. MJ-SS2]|uniref:hypothetical protein n=1 Tax=Aliisedimentitalea sp. MJ-SS2 TaxID=3049795 RepID=UPI00290E50B8|nr:hypothetical protein [Alisedimentitalea sp. MJ-SS2]MDU8929459.1 hypothetical protein [Alisedimentitalea sp. MJ-SS2]
MAAREILRRVIEAVLLAGRDVSPEGQYTTGKVKPAEASEVPVAPAGVAVFAGAPDKPFTEVKALDITVNKLTAFHPNPTKEAVLTALRKEAA